MTSIYDWFGYNIPIKDRYKYIKAAGFDGVLLWWSSDFGRGEDYKNGAQLARNAGLIVENIHTPILQEIFDLEEDFRKQYLYKIYNLLLLDSIFSFFDK